MATVLVIEDNEDNFELIKFILETNGDKVTRAATGLEGVALALTLQPDFILLDIQLPDIDGEEVLRRLRNNSVSQTIPVIAVTSYAMSGDRERLLNSGCNGYIEKPIEPYTIIQQIKTIVYE